MTATIDYDIKRGLHLLTKNDRWNVLTVLMLHANIRNRCHVSMDTIARMATNGNRTRATDAKKWLEKHEAFELVPFGKRLEDERKLSPRQHVYQLKGSFHACDSQDCDCGNDGQVYAYLYHGKIESLDGQTINSPKNLNGQTIENLDGQIFDSLNGQTGSIPLEVKDSNAPVGTIPANTINPMKDAIAKAFNYTWATMSKPEKGLVQLTAKELCEAGITPAEVPALYAYCKGRFTNFKPRALSTNVSDWRKTTSNPVSVLDGLRLVS